MNNQEAKFILSAYRPSGEDAAKFAEALAQVSLDPELAAWFADQRRFDVANCDAVGSIPIPPDLRGNILAGGKISRRRFWPIRRGLLAIAASIMFLATVTGIWTRHSRLDTWQRDGLAAILKLDSGQSPFDHPGNDGRALQEWLYAQHAPAADSLPVALQKLPALGCKTISSAGKTVSITCFRLRGKELVHLVVTNASDLNHAPPQQPRFLEAEGSMTASWTANGHACMLVTKGSSRELQDLLATTAQSRHVGLALVTKI